MRQYRVWSAVLATVALTASSALAGTFYNTEGSFVSAIQASPYIENFTGWTFGSPLNGSQTSYVAPGGNGFGWTASATGGLYSNISSLSTNLANDPILITFTAGNVTALGGNFVNTDISGAIIPGTVTVTTSDGGVQAMVNPTGSSFLGYTSAVPIVSVTISATSGATNNWPQVDHFYTATAAVPEPATISVAALGMGFLAARRRRA